MAIQVKNKQDFYAGVMFVVVGVAAAIGATQYSMGTAARMGPGYFPFWLGVCLAVLGAVVTVSATTAKAQIQSLEKFDFKIATIIIGSVALAGTLLNYLGIYLTTFLLVVGCSTASHVFNWKVAVITGICLSIFVWLAFVEGLGLIFPLWPDLAGY